MLSMVTWAWAVVARMAENVEEEALSLAQTIDASRAALGVGGRHVANCGSIWIAGGSLWRRGLRGVALCAVELVVRDGEQRGRGGDGGNADKNLRILWDRNLARRLVAWKKQCRRERVSASASLNARQHPAPSSSSPSPPPRAARTLETLPARPASPPATTSCSLARSTALSSSLRRTRRPRLSRSKSPSALPPRLAKSVGHPFLLHARTRPSLPVGRPYSRQTPLCGPDFR